ncbi:hypothetical protein PG291_07210 [Riemerella anatipestifer]|nr:hypothetical protein [Riemerella anatipestifer]
MDVLILSKTHMNNGKCCIGGITGSGRYVRLLTPTGDNQPENTDLTPRQVWEVEFIERPHTTPPHIEDVLVTSRKIKESLKDEITILEFIKQRKIQIWKGNPEVLFDTKIKWTDNGSGYINKEAVPQHSVGFWISDKDLTKSIYYGKPRYSYRSVDGWRSLPYVGFDEPIDIIPKGTLIRVSLARWWDTKGTTELRCPLQLSGWYDLNEKTSNDNSDDWSF